MFAYCGNNPVTRKDSAGTTYVFLDEFIAEVDPDGQFDEGGAGGGFGLGVKPSFYTAQRVQTYDSSWQNSSYNQNPTGPVGTSYCFIAGTLVQCEDGTKPIEEIEAGDLVWACNEETGDVALKEVVETYVNETSELVHIFVDGEEIVTTPAHPFYSPLKGWTDAVKLRAGDILVLVDGEYVVVEKVQYEILETPVTVYNFQVEDYHTYYVSSTSILVHNSCDYKPLRDGDMRAVINPGELESPHAHIFQKSNNIGRVFSNGTMDASLLNNRDGVKFVKKYWDAIMALIGDFYGKR